MVAYFDTIFLQKLPEELDLPSEDESEASVLLRKPKLRKGQIIFESDTEYETLL